MSTNYNVTLLDGERTTEARVRSDYAANNLAVVRHIVMNLLRLNTTRKASRRSKRMLAATLDGYRAELLGLMP